MRGMSYFRFESHSHSEYSNLRLLDCINKPKDLVNRAIELGLSGIAITDHESLSAHPELNIYQQEIIKEHPDFKIALGNEIYLCANREKNQEYYHFILIAKNAAGHRALRELSSKAWLNSYTDRGMERVVTTYDDLEKIVQKFPSSLVACTACLGSEVSKTTLKLIQAERNGDEPSRIAAHNHIINFILWCKKLFGDDFYLECAPGCSKDQIDVNQRFLSIAHAFGLKMIVGTDAHFLKKEDRYVHKAYLNSKGGEREVDSFYEYAYLQSNEEIIENLAASNYDVSFVEQMFKNSMEIYNKIENYSILHNQQIPDVEVIDYQKKKVNGLTEYPELDRMFQSDDKIERYWVNQCFDNFEKKFQDSIINHKEYINELEEEAEVKKIVGDRLGTNMFRYPILLQHYIDLFWECGSTVGAGRGSACAALNHYLLGITQLNPIQYELPFFRYMNRDTVELGDVDLDLAPDKRPLILQKIKEERKHLFNEDLDEQAKENLGCTLIATFGTESAKSAVLTACFKRGTPILTDSGIKEIQEITSSDYVYTTNGWEKVITPTLTSWDKNFISFDGQYSFTMPITCTEDHEFLILPKTNSHYLTGGINQSVIKKLIPEYDKLPDKKKAKYRNYIRNISPLWVEAKNLKDKDYLLTRIDTREEDIEIINWEAKANKNSNFIKNKIKIDNNFCELIGIWLAEGSINRSMFSFTIASYENELKSRIVFLMSEVFGLENPYINLREENHSVVIQYASADLRDFIYELFDISDFSELNQWNKFIPKKLKYINPQKQLQIFKGWIIGDGTYRERKNQEWSGSKELKGTTVSYQLICDMIFILNRNYLNPSFQKEQRKEKNKKDVFNIILSGKVAEKIGNLKYKNYEQELIINWEDRLGKDIPCVFNDNLYLRCPIKNKKNIQNNTAEDVYCLIVPSHNFTVSNIIAHNCRGYRSEDCPSGIDVDIAQYLSSLIASERGFVWSLHDMFEGNQEKDRKPNQTFINEVEQYPGLKEIMLGIESLINKRSSHASGVIMFERDPYEHGCFMRTPSGEIITQYDLHMDEASGMTKLDLLVTEVQSKITQTLLLLQKDGILQEGLTLRQLYDKYIHPDVLPLDDKKVWNAIQGAKVLDLFQFDTSVGSQGVKKVKPETIQELSATNGLIRLMPADKNSESPMDIYLKRKKNPDLIHYEMKNKYHLTIEEENAINKYVGSTYGIGISQEQFMRAVMDKDICGFSLKESNDARRIISKKKMDKIPELKEKIFERASSPAVAQYVWDYIASTQLGYAFSDIHSLSYSFIGFQTAYLGVNWNPVYWNTACLIVNSGSLDDDGQTDYAKIAKALGKIINNGIKVSCIDINESEYTFKPDAIHNQILFGMKSLNKVGSDVVQQIIAHRAYKSINDFMNKCPLNKTVMVSLIKSGAFDETDEAWAKTVNPSAPRRAIMAYYISKICEPKKKLTLQNLSTLIQKNLIPDSLSLERQVFLLNKKLKNQKEGKEYYLLKEDDFLFYEEHFSQDDLTIIGGKNLLPQSEWDNIYSKMMNNIREWLKENQERVLNELNDLLFKECWDKYATGTVSAWEMESMCFYYHEHELAKVNTSKYGISDFNKLPTVPKAEKFFKKKGKEIPIYETTRIIGTVLGKNDVRSTVSILTTTGVVDVKFTKEYYANYNRQLSEVQLDGTKKVIDKSWFTRGTKIMVTGYRIDDTFRAKSYSHTSTHQLYRIKDVTNDGQDIILEHERG